MPFQLSPSILGVIVVAAIISGLAIWLFAGMQWNLRRGNDALRWLRDGMPVIAERTTLSRPGASLVGLSVKAAHAPFKQVDVLIVLEPHDQGPLWLLRRWRGQRDTMVLRGIMRRTARYDFDLLDEHSWAGRQALAKVTPPEWERQTRPDGLICAARTAAAAQAAGRMAPMLQRMGGRALRVSARRNEPQLEIHLISPWLSGATSKAMMEALLEAGDLLLA